MALFGRKTRPVGDADRTPAPTVERDATASGGDAQHGTTDDHPERAVGGAEPSAFDGAEPRASEQRQRPGLELPRRTLEEQRSFLVDQVGAMRPFGMQIWDVPGLVLCEDITSDLDLPLVTTARVTGWAVRGSDLVGATPENPKALFMVDSISVTDGPGRPLVEGATLRIEEGSILPRGVDAVVPAEEGELRPDGYVLIRRETRLYENLRRAGSELADGTPLLRAGEVLTPRSVAVLAEVGLDKVLVRPHPRVAIFTVGSTLIAPGQPLTQPQQRYDAASALITAAARNDGATVYPLGIVAADAASVRKAITDQQIRADLIVVVGGGELIREVAHDMGELDEATVAINRQAHIAYASLGEDRTPLIILPAGVVTSYVAYQALVRPVLNKLNQVDPLRADRLEGRLVDRLEVPAGATQFIPAIRDAEGAVRPVAGVDSELAWDLARANVLAVIPDFWAGADAGSVIECIVLDDARVAATTGP